MAPVIPPIISVDDHVIEPPNVWQDRLPERLREVGPRIERRKVKNMQFVGGVFSYEEAGVNEDGTWCDWWLVEDLQSPLTRLSAAAGYPREEVTVSPITMDDMRKGCWDQKARLADMDVN
ncbi:MAG: amidohydrolase, partial [Actinomycetota bacterium]